MSLYQAKYRIEPARLRDWDYRSLGWYFVTICTQHRASIFGQVVRGQIELSRLGHIAYSELTNLPSHYLNVQIDAHIVMPLHHLDATIGLNHVKVIHCNDAKAARGSRLDRHQQAGKGTIRHRALPYPAQRPPPRPCRLHRRNPHRPTRRRPQKCRSPEEAGDLALPVSTFVSSYCP